MILKAVIRAYFTILVLTSITSFTAQESTPDLESLHLVSSFSPQNPDQVCLNYVSMEEDDYKIVATVRYKPVAQDTAFISDFMVLPSLRNKKLGTKLFFEDLTKQLKQNKFKRSEWYAGYWDVQDDCDDLQDIVAREITNEEYHRQLPRLIQFYERHGALAPKQANGSYKYCINQNSGRKVIPFSIELENPATQESKTAKFKRARPQPVSAHRA